MKLLLRVIGAVGTLTFLILFVVTKNFLSLNSLLLFIVFACLIFDQTWELLRRMGPFIVLLLTYDGFKLVGSSLMNRTHYTLMPTFDKALFGNLPTVTLQKWLWHGHVQWYDFIFYGTYMMHFLLPIVLALLIWKFRESLYWQFITTYVSVSFACFLIYLAYPTAPPWLASQNGYIPHITRIPNAIYASIGVRNFSSLYDRFAPNAVAAAPSMHAAFATLFSLFILKCFGKKWGALSLIYPLIIIVGIVYMGEHYVFDAITGIALAAVGYTLAPYILRQIQRFAKQVLTFSQEPGLAKDAD